MADEDSSQRYFDEIRTIWSPFAARHRIIPFCTAVFLNPTALVIGTNHSDFVDGGGSEADRIALEFASGVSTLRNTYLDDNHKFAVGLRRVCQGANVGIERTWIGTNRCVVQAGHEGLKELASNTFFKECRQKMDVVLPSGGGDFTPQRYPCWQIRNGPLLRERGGMGVTFDDLLPREPDSRNPYRPIRLIPIQIVSRPVFWTKASSQESATVSSAIRLSDETTCFRRLSAADFGTTQRFLFLPTT